MTESLIIINNNKINTNHFIYPAFQVFPDF